MKDFIPSRRSLLAAAPFLALAGAVRAQDSREIPYRFGETPEEAERIAFDAHEELMDLPDLHMHGNEKIAMLAYPGMTVLDLIGPQYMFASMMGASVQVVSADKALAPIVSDTKVALVPDVHFDDCPEELDILFVPGGTSGTVAAMRDPATMEFLKDRAPKAKLVTAVCTGSLILGQAGLLDGKRATCHWAARHLLPEFGATAVNARVVEDGDLITGGGVTAGIDFGLSILARLRGEGYAKVVQLQAEYAPAPPFDSGTPEAAGPAVTEPMQGMFASFLHSVRETARSR
ncbi:DJ-1/PfpI family protein [uncultured Algimonas sp.]|uniref:DJ-1/PfpI family protein n=1 Tax=uncultured Algimonas sp. TaxID=1547920 RepID=UPI0026143048|nr:DJ-1/PfpI family protein [uncultured Algimonas sp.]